MEEKRRERERGKAGAHLDARYKDAVNGSGLGSQSDPSIGPFRSAGGSSQNGSG